MSAKQREGDDILTIRSIASPETTGETPESGETFIVKSVRGDVEKAIDLDGSFDISDDEPSGVHKKSKATPPPLPPRRKTPPPTPSNKSKMEKEGKDTEYYLGRAGLMIKYRRSSGEIDEGLLVDNRDSESFEVLRMSDNSTDFAVNTNNSKAEIFELNPGLEAKMEALAKGNEALKKEVILVKDLMEAKKKELELSESVKEIQGLERERQAPEAGEVIMNNNDWLSDDIHSVEMTDADGNPTVSLALATCKTPNYKTDINEDSIAYNPIYHTTVVTDGMGGMGDGDIATEVISHHYSSIPFNKEAIEGAAKNAAAELKEKGVKKGGGACFAMTHVEPGEEIKIAEAGDVLVVIKDENGNTITTSSDLREKLKIAPQSLIEFLGSDEFKEEIPQNKRAALFMHYGKLNPKEETDREEAKLMAERVEKGEKPIVNKEMKAFKALNAAVYNSITADLTKPAVYGTGIVAKPGMTVDVYTDGVIDLEGALKEITEKTKGIDSPKERMELISGIAQEHQGKEGAKIDNMGVATITVRGETA